jgi:hypothetical protein
MTDVVRFADARIAQEVQHETTIANVSDAIDPTEYGFI